MVRAFIAVSIKPTQELAAFLARLRRLGGSVKTVADENLHITLRFLGQIEEVLLKPITDAVRDATRNTKAFDLNLVGVGAYPRLERPSVVWAGVDDSGILPTLVHRLAKPLHDLGVGPEDRPWSAHVTLGRIKNKPPTALCDLLNAHRSVPFGAVRVRSIDLLTSQLRSAGPIYTTAGRVLLG